MCVCVFLNKNRRGKDIDISFQNTLKLFLDPNSSISQMVWAAGSLKKFPLLFVCLLVGFHLSKVPNLQGNKSVGHKSLTTTRETTLKVNVCSL